MTDFMTIFREQFAPRLGARKPTFRALFEAMPPTPVIVEIGSLRDVGEKSWLGDGRSTVMFDCYVATSGGAFWSVDTNPDATIVTKAMTKHCIAVTESGERFLEGFPEPIDVLYLDSSDDPADTSRQFCAARSKLAPGAIVAVDDTFWSYGTHPWTLNGKGRYLLDAIGKKPIFEGYGFVWRL